MARSYHRVNLRNYYNRNRSGSMIKGLLIWLALGGASFLIGFMVLARLIPTARQPESSTQHRPLASDPAQAARITATSETQSTPVAATRSQISADSPSPSNRSTRNMLTPSIDPIEKSAPADTPVQKPDGVDGTTVQNNTTSNDRSDRSLRSDTISPSIDPTTQLVTPRKSKRRHHRKIKQEAVQSPTSLDNASEPMPAAPSLEPGGDTEAPPPAAN